VELPTYTNIWRIEKRLYKLYDFRLPMPLPVGQIAVFLAIAVPYVLVLSLLGLPFSHTLLWVYVLPPGVLAWLTTRPVLESKRLPELVMSQVRYVLEPRTWCRMAPLAEKDEVIVFCRVWRQAESEPGPEVVVAPARVPGRVPARRDRPIARPPALAPRQAAQASPGRAARGAAAPGRVTQASPGRAIHGQLSHGQLSHGQVSYGQVSYGQVSHAQMSQGQLSHGQVSYRQVSHGQVNDGRVVQGQVSRGRPAPSWPLRSAEAQEQVAPAAFASGQGAPAPAAPGPAVPGPAAHGPAAHGPAAHGPAAHGPAPWPSGPKLPAQARRPAETPGGESFAPEPAAQRSAGQAPARPEPTEARARGVASTGPGPTVTAAGTAAAGATAAGAASGPGAQPRPRADRAASWPAAAGATSGHQAQARPPAGGQPAEPREADRPAAQARPVVPGQLSPPAAPPSPAAGAAPPASRPAPTGTGPAAGTRQGADMQTPVGLASPIAARQAPSPQPPAEQSPPAAGAPAHYQPASSGGQDAPPSRPARPTVTVTGDLAAERPLRVVERALRSQPGQRPDGWRDRVVVVPGGHRPGKPDPLQRDRARARLPIDGPLRIVVLGCTRGAGQTTAALLAGDMLASLRAEPVAVLDLNPGRGSLSERAAAIPGLMPEPPDAASVAGVGGVVAADLPLAAPVAADPQAPDSGLQVITGSPAAQGGDDAGRLFGLVAARYRLTLADPAAGCVPRTLDVANQLMIVAPASAAAANALAMTFEWLEAHGYGRLAATAITVLNGVSGPTSSHVEHAANVATGRCRAIVKVPWDNHLREYAQGRPPARPDAAADTGAAGPPAPADARGLGLLSPALNQAYTALAGVLIAGLADPAELRSTGA